MAEFRVDEAESFGGNGGGGFFSLKNHKDTAKVRFLYDNINDVKPRSVHEVDVNGKKREVDCLRGYGEPVDVCPFCAANYPTRVKYHIPVYDVANKRSVIFERGKSFGSKLSGLCARYSHLFQRVFDIERHGAAGDKETTYEIYPTDEMDANLRLEDFEIPKVLGTIVLTKTAEEMQYYVDRKVFPDDSSTPVRRSDNNDQYVRRTPANTNTDREVF